MKIIEENEKYLYLELCYEELPLEIESNKNIFVRIKDKDSDKNFVLCKGDIYFVQRL